MTAPEPYTREQLEAYALLLELEQARKSFAAFMDRVASKWSSGEWRHVAHLDYLTGVISAGVTRGGMRLIVTMPPRHGKSELCSHWLPVGFLIANPQKRVILASYEASFAASWGRKVRESIAEIGALYGVALRSDSTAVDAWELTSGGGMVTSGVGGPITGRGADLMVIDDPVKNAEEASSPVMREKVWEWYRTVARTRLEPNASIVVVMTRWDVDDLAGRLLASTGENWQVVNLPAVAEGRDAIGRAPGVPLWPERYDLAALGLLRSGIQEDAWASLYQQHPNPSGRGFFFDVDSVRAFNADVKEPVETQRGGVIGIWKKPLVAAKYVFGGDVAWGEKGAYAVLTIEDYQTRDTMAEIYGRLPLDELAFEAVKLASWYNNAYGAVERNGEGEKVCAKMVELGYKDHMFFADWESKDPVRPGWQTTGTTRPVMLATLEEDVRRHAFVPRCKDEVAEMLGFVRDEKGKPGPRPGTHSDHVMARAICGAVRQHAHRDSARSVAVKGRW